MKYDVAAYIWPAFSGNDNRARIFWEEGIGEWQTVQRCRHRSEDYEWNRRPLWGYQNEADPYVMEGQIEAAADHGVNVFIYDWYWYDGRPFLENCLNDGFLKAKNNHKVRFYLMWANHDAGMGWDIRYDAPEDVPVWSGTVDRAEFEKIGRRMIEKYFLHPSYYRIDDKPVLSIYNINSFLQGLGGISAACDALEWLRRMAEKYGLPGVHVQAILYREGSNMSGVDGGVRQSGAELMKTLRVDSVTNYQFIHFMGETITRDYAEVAEVARQYWEQTADAYDAAHDIPYFPHVSVGWDPSPRRRDIYPYRALNNTPDHIEKAMRMAKEFVDSHLNTPLITVNSWNEWTETSYIQPDNRYGYGYLEAIRNVFKQSDQLKGGK